MFDIFNKVVFIAFLNLLDSIYCDKKNLGLIILIKKDYQLNLTVGNQFLLISIY
jgi:hypothetical protein